MLTDNQLNEFQQYGAIIIDDFMPASIPLEIGNYIDCLSAAQQLKQATIGKAQFNQINTNERGDFIQWIDPANCILPIQDLLTNLLVLRQNLNQHFYLGLRDFECHLTQYPIGTSYKRHVDRHKNGSTRRVSVVYYLTENWQETNGGELMIYTPEKNIEVQPHFGRLALFLSELEHEVLPTQIIRKSLTGWMLNEEII
jgi:SM-20-related protein